MKIVFMGTPEFAVPTLETLSQNHEIVCVYTRAPSVSGRGNELQKSPAHLWALEHGVEVCTPKTLRNEVEQQKFREWKADVAIVAAYGLILPKEIIEACPKGCLNVHGSLLPRWRGAAPMQRAIEAGDKTTGITIMQVVEKLDAGAMYKKGEIVIDEDMTVGVLHDKMAALGAKLMSEVLDKLDEITPVEQDESLATYAAKIDKAESRLNFTEDAIVLERKIRAFNPYPAAYFEHKGERFKLLKCKVRCDITGPKAGEIRQENNKLFIICGKGALQAEIVQRQGKKAMTAEELLRGYSFL
ncbi:MAG: methionyl-tRNA formyltransferase [Alphaproteobacteria bacterium]|nr:methionyl-tRNA formyltransferase [Alphaproteobacteria bacterium]